MRNSVRWLIVGVLLLAAASTAQAQTYYVAKAAQGGSDVNNDCTEAQSVSTPKLTIAAGIACMNGGGDTVLVRAGTYDENLSSVPSGTSWSNLVRIANYNSETVTVKPATPNTAGVLWISQATSYVEFDGIDFDNSNLSSGGAAVIWFSTNQSANVHHIRVKNAEVTQAGLFYAAIQLGGSLSTQGGFELQNLEVHGHGGGGTCGSSCQSYGIYVTSPNNLIEGCDIHDVSARGISVHRPSGGASNNVIRNNRVHDITVTGTTGQYIGILIADSATNNYVYNNLIYDIGVGGNGNGIDVGSNASGNKVWNNTVYSNDKYGILVGASTSSTTVYNNISDENGTADYSNASGTTTASNNLFSATVVFLDAASDDFHLTSSSTNAIDQGTNIAAVSGVVTEDFAGTARPQGNAWDIGAYEFFVTPPPTPPTCNITAPTESTAYETQTTPLTTLAGTGTDTDGTIASTGVTWSSSAGGSGTASVTGGGTASVTWSVSSIVLVNDAQTITVTCTDNGALTHQDSLTVTYTAPSPPPQPGGKRLRLTP